jgi:hypothetical protein
MIRGVSTPPPDADVLAKVLRLEELARTGDGAAIIAGIGAALDNYTPPRSESSLDKPSGHTGDPDG